MRTIRVRWLLLIAAAAAVIGWLVTLLTALVGWSTPVLPLSSLFTMAVMAGFTLFLGLRVLRWRQGNRRRQLNLLLAARTLVLAQAGAYAGALLLGWHVGILVDQLPLWAYRSDNSISITAIALMIGGLIMIIIGLIVERFCRIPPEDTDDVGGGSTKERRGEEYA